MSLTSEARSLRVGEETLDYTLRRTGRRRTVGIFVEPERRLTVLSPQEADIEAVERILRRRLPWIRRQRRELEALPPPSPVIKWCQVRFTGRCLRATEAAAGSGM